METVKELMSQMQQGTLSSEALVKRCIDKIDKTDSDIRAWIFVDRKGAIEQAKAMDLRRAQGKSLGALHGIPVGLKDIVDTHNMLTEFGSPIYKGRQPDADALIVEKLIESGAIILGKTVTTEFAYLNESHTRNPHNLAHTPGGSSSGSAAAVAAGQVPLAIGSQTGGSVIRPASFNGVYGCKPSRGVVPRRGVLQTSQTLDHIGVFAGDAGDMALLLDVIKGFDSQDAVSQVGPLPTMAACYESDDRKAPRLVYIDLPYKDRFSPALNQAMEGALKVLSNSAASIDRIDSPPSFAQWVKCHKVIYDYEILRCLDTEWNSHRELLSQTIKDALSLAEARTEAEYEDALGVREAANLWFKSFFEDYDAIVTPAAIGAAPLIGQGTGDPINSIIWTLCGLPCITLPLLTGEHESGEQSSGQSAEQFSQQAMPMGLQLVGAHDYDHRLFGAARWMVNELNS